MVKGTGCLINKYRSEQLKDKVWSYLVWFGFVIFFDCKVEFGLVLLLAFVQFVFSEFSKIICQKHPSKPQHLKKLANLHTPSQS